MCGSGPSVCKPCQARTLSAMKAVSAPTVQVSAIPNSRNRPVAPGRAAQRPDKKGKRRAAGACARQSAEDHRRIERHVALSEPLEVTAKPRGAIPLGVGRQQFRRMRDMVGDVGEPGIEQIEQDANAGQEEYRRQRHLNHVSRHVDRQLCGGQGHRFKPQTACVGLALAVSGGMLAGCPEDTTCAQPPPAMWCYVSGPSRHSARRVTKAHAGSDVGDAIAASANPARHSTGDVPPCGGTRG